MTQDMEEDLRGQEAMAFPHGIPRAGKAVSEFQQPEG